MFNLPIFPLPFPGMGVTNAVALPVGTVVAYAGKISSSSSDPPSAYITNIEALGWMLCDGKSLEVSQYPDLFAVLGYLYGRDNDKFNIPDYRGIFLRGVDSGANNDPDILDRTDPADPKKKTKNDGVGSRQEDALQTHQHEYARLSETTGGTENKAAMLVDGANTPTSEPKEPARTSAETRPKNVYVHYIIKYIKG
jgi:microcystin-dependent protein